MLKQIAAMMRGFGEEIMQSFCIQKNEITLPDIDYMMLISHSDQQTLQKKNKKNK